VGGALEIWDLQMLDAGARSTRSTTQGAVLPTLDQLARVDVLSADQAGPAGLPAQRGLLRDLHRGAVLYGAFAYVFFLHSRGLLLGLASGTNWVFRDESMHMAFALDVVETVRREEPDLFDEQLADDIRLMLADAVDAEVQFAEDLLVGGVAGLSVEDMRTYLQHVADKRLQQVGLDPVYGARNPFAFLELQDVQEPSFERRVSAQQTRVTGVVAFDDHF